ncbi:MAG: helix-turn-helix domain-containing protein [Bradyrhizobium sp.]
MAKRTPVRNTNTHPTIYAGRQPRRPHYVAEWMERRHITTQVELAEAIGADKSVISRWLDENNPATPGREWQAKLGAFFAGGEDDPVDIFRHPDDDWFARMVRNNTEDRIKTAIQILEAAGITADNKRPKKASNRS